MGQVNPINDVLTNVLTQIYAYECSVVSNSETNVIADNWYWQNSSSV